MAIVNISPSRILVANINYINGGKSEERVAAKSGYLVNPDDVIFEMRRVQYLHNKQEGYVQAQKIIQSFDPEEFDANNPEDVERANLLGYELAKELYPDNQAYVVTHVDSKSGVVHNHIIVNNVICKGENEGKSLRDYVRSWAHVAQANDRVLKANGIEPLEQSKITDYKRNKRKQTKSFNEQQMQAQGKVTAKQQCMNDIDYVLDEEGAQGLDDFIEAMEAKGYDINIRNRKNRETGVKEPNISFKHEENGLRRVNGKRLDDTEAYSLSMITERLEKNYTPPTAEQDAQEDDLEALFSEILADAERSREINEAEAMRQQAERLEAERRRVKAEAERIEREQAEEARQNEIRERRKANARAKQRTNNRRTKGFEREL